MRSHYSIGEFAKRIGRSVQTVRRWEREGKLQAKRLPSGHRYFDESDVRLMLGGAPRERDVVVYCRVSSAGQKDDLASQVQAMETYCLGAGIAVDEWIQEVGGGMNFKRKRFLGLVDRIQRGEVRLLLVAHKDRLMRFGFDLLAHLADENGCEIVVVNQESLSPEQEMVEDLLAIVHTFSCRLYGMRKYKQSIKEDFAEMPLRQPKDACE
ncbi:Predicted site-specific integrase-resolvase [Ectothiorhodospira magna]|uniref:Predicted site-specific integrase-resolvase n=1 Tax=Ectothiorhodospira magna TaxID=867345 RepID=A0A1H9GUL7_9GAMM|nr:IS607 family transposase [Ectothiorhodospira magna]SEQ53740.1 Predicted site-specific integrase-resolvase [Ectothiorhodospira magna]